MFFPHNKSANNIFPPWLSSDSGTGCDGLMVSSFFCIETRSSEEAYWTTLVLLYYAVMHVFWATLFLDSIVIYLISLSCHVLAETDSLSIELFSVIIYYVNLIILFTLMLTTINACLFIQAHIQQVKLMFMESFFIENNTMVYKLIFIINLRNMRSTKVLSSDILSLSYTTCPFSYLYIKF